MKHREDGFWGAGKLRLYCQCWHPDHHASAIMVLVHGIGAHSGWFPHVVSYLVSADYAVYAFDLRGHGKSEGQRGYINRWDEFRTDLRIFLQLITAETPDLPCFLLGHSMGGTIVLDYILHDPTGLRGAIVMAPALEQIGTDPWRVGLGYLLSALCPRFSLGLGLAIGARDPQLLQAFESDPLRHTQGTARLMTEFFDTVNWIESHIGELNIPLLILHGDADRVSAGVTSRQLVERITFPDTTRFEYPGLYHELHNDWDYSQVLTDLLAWLAQHRE